MILPSIATDHITEALTRAYCDGDGTITLATTDGPYRTACNGCTNCTRAAARRAYLASDGGKALAEQRRRMHFTAVREATDDDEEW